MRVTMADIALETGLTLGTVSRALNTAGNYAIAPDTRKRVIEAAARLGYRPNLIGKALKSRSTGLILLVTPDPFAPYYVEISRHLSAQAAQGSFNFVAGGALPIGDQVSIPADDWLYGVDGIVVCDCLPHQEAYVAEAIRLRIPIVGLGMRDPFVTDFVKVDLYPAARDLTKHLIEQGGCRCPVMLRASLAADDPRHQAYRDTIAAYGLKERFIQAQNQSRFIARESVIEGYQAESFDGLVCENDLMAVGALRGLMDLGIRVPEDVRLAGCDGLEEVCYQSVPITTIVQPIEAMCSTAWEMLRTRIESPDAPVRKVEIPATLAVRASTQIG